MQRNGPKRFFSFCARALSCVWRRGHKDVVALLDENHRNHYRVFNLAVERQYDYSKFHNQVVSWCGFPDHHSPPLRLLLRTLHAMQQWLLADDRNVVVVHCLVCLAAHSRRPGADGAFVWAARARAHRRAKGAPAP